MNKVKPLLSCEVPLDKVSFPIYVSTKFDGIRALVIDGVVYSRSLKPIRNKHVQNLFGKPEYEGFDGELVVGDIYAKDGMQPMNTLVSLVLKYGDTMFKCGTGFNDEQRKEVWLNKDKYIGKLASIRYMSVGSKDLPRVPSFQGFRDKDDM